MKAQRPPRPAWLRSALLGVMLAAGLLEAADAQTNRSAMGYYRRESDEASRQRMMNSFRRDAETSARRQQELRDRNAYKAPSNSGDSSRTRSERSNSVGAGLPALGSDSLDDGERSVTTTTETLRVRETEAETVQRVLREAAAGQPEAMWNAGRLWYAGGYGGLQADNAQALAWWRKAAQAGHAEAATALGEALLHGRGTAADATAAARWFKAGAEGGVPRGQLMWGMALAQGQGVARDQTAAANWFVRAADQGEPLALWLVGSDMMTGGWWARNPTQARRYLVRASQAEQPVPDALNNLATMLFDGEGGDKDPAQAHALWSRCAAQAHAPCQFNLAQSLLRGRGGMTPNPAEGLRLLRLAADAGNLPEAQFSLAARLLEGQPSQPAEAAGWFKRAADQGHADSQGLYGAMLVNGMAGTRDEAEGLRLLRASAQQGSVLGAEHLGRVLTGSNGVRPDMTEAARWNRVAAEAGRWEAQYRWGWQLKHGQGVGANGHEAYRWLRLAAGKGIQAAQEELDPAFVQANR